MFLPLKPHLQLLLFLQSCQQYLRDKKNLACVCTLLRVINCTLMELAPYN